MEKSYKDIVATTFNETAAKFDRIGTSFFKEFGKRMAKFSSINKGDRIIDVACGNGAVTIPVAKKINDDGHVTGIDIAHKMIEECESLKAKLQISNVDFKVMDIESLEFEDETFDKVYCGFGIFFLPNVLKGLNEVKRVLKPGGEFIFSTWNKEYNFDWLISLLIKYLPHMTAFRQYNDDEIERDDFTTIEGIEKLCKLSGLKKQQIKIENVNTYYIDENEWLERWWNTGYRMFFKQLSNRDYDKFKNEALEMIKTYKEYGKIKIIMSAFFTKAIK